MKSRTLNSALLPPIEQAARQEYEYFGSTLTTNTALKVALLCAFAIIGILSWNTVRLSRVAWPTGRYLGALGCRFGGSVRPLGRRAASADW
jgi:hypothetical protein